MRQVILGAIAVFAAGSAFASSIEVVGTGAGSGSSSILTKVCTTCPPLQPKQMKKDYIVPTLADGALEHSQIRDIDGEKKLYRTEGWMGGSPVVFVTKAPTTTAIVSAPDGIDETATTAAVIGTNTKPVAAGVAGAREQIAPLDVSSFELRP
ncbi:plant virulence effector HPE1-like domain-containing protein [Rhizobium sp. S96]|uniref:plant virulence effector HPE1-like domain-containing protein n=1 Tax=Rhizobium sp. S96 TaxID=3055140 RepID=UPI0025AA3C5B|nr:plant virulence effector HPE1-like domain-containing protein [Rhizobium sp. S96]MDM9623745.1 plant virulence effector HPE1-like domain-containing protein [Rhizobium sp. S96]